MNKSYTWKHSPKTFKKLLEESINWSDLAKNCGYNCTSNFRTLKKRIKNENLDSSHLDKYVRINYAFLNKKPIEEIWNSEKYISSRSEFTDQKEITVNTICNVCKNETHSKRLNRVEGSFAIKI